METTIISKEGSDKISCITNKISGLRDQLFDIFSITFDKVSAYGIKTVQRVFTGVRSLFVDVIVRNLNQIGILVKELKTVGYEQGFESSYIESLINLQKKQLMTKMSHHLFFHENFSRRINEIFAI